MEDFQILILPKNVWKYPALRTETKEAPTPPSSFILVSCAPILADKLGVPGARPRLGFQSSLLGGTVSLTAEPAANTSPTRDETSLECRTAPFSYFRNVKNVSVFQPAFVRDIPCLFSILLAMKRKSM